MYVIYWHCGECGGCGKVEGDQHTLAKATEEKLKQLIQEAPNKIQHEHKDSLFILAY